MCLEPEYFEDVSRRKFMRDIQGVTPDEAIQALNLITSTIYPVAIEMAEWLSENWSKKQIAIRLGDEYLDIVEGVVNK